MERFDLGAVGIWSLRLSFGSGISILWVVEMEQKQGLLLIFRLDLLVIKIIG